MYIFVRSNPKSSRVGACFSDYNSDTGPVLRTGAEARRLLRSTVDDESVQSHGRSPFSDTYLFWNRVIERFLSEPDPLAIAYGSDLACFRIVGIL